MNPELPRIFALLALQRVVWDRPAPGLRRGILASPPLPAGLVVALATVAALALVGLSLYRRYRKRR